MDELKPCPFCGGRAAYGKTTYPKDSETARLNGQNVFIFINCVNCAASVGGHSMGYLTTNEAADGWNRMAGYERA